MDTFTRKGQVTKKPDPKPTHHMPSGMGGVVEVAIVADLGEGALVRIISKAYPDWHGKEYTVHKSALTPIAA